MKKVDLTRFKIILYKHFKHTLKKFAATRDNKDVYAVILDCHATYGSVKLKWNTLDSFEQYAAKYYSSYKQDQLFGFNGLKYSVGDFCYEDKAPPAKLSKYETLYENNQFEYFEQEQDAELEELTESFIDMLVEIIHELKPEFDKLNKTDNFIAYIVEHDSNDHQYIKRTVLLEEYYRAFPEIKHYEQYLDTIYALPKEDQVTHWCNVLDHFSKEVVTEETKRLELLYRSKYDVEAEIIKLGAIAASHIVALFDSYSDSDEHTRWTFLSILIDIQDADEATLERLKQILITKYEQERKGNEIINIARTLHALAPLRFPEEIHDDGRLNLLNFEQYKEA